MFDPQVALTENEIEWRSFHSEGEAWWPLELERVDLVPFPAASSGQYRARNN